MILGEYTSPSRRGSASSYKSYSLTVQGASKLSANIRERLLLGGNFVTIGLHTESSALILLLSLHLFL